MKESFSYVLRGLLSDKTIGAYTNTNERRAKMLVPRLLHNSARMKSQLILHNICATHAHTHTLDWPPECIENVFHQFSLILIKTSGNDLQNCWARSSVDPKSWAQSLKIRALRLEVPFVEHSLWIFTVKMLGERPKSHSSTPTYFWSKHNSHVDQVEGAGHSFYQQVLRYNQHSSTHKSEEISATLTHTHTHMVCVASFSWLLYGKYVCV